MHVDVVGLCVVEMSTTGSMVTLSSLATFDEDTDTLQVRSWHVYVSVWL
jgi:hypothetical protein